MESLWNHTVCLNDEWHILYFIVVVFLTALALKLFELKRHKHKWHTLMEQKKHHDSTAGKTARVNHEYPNPVLYLKQTGTLFTQFLWLFIYYCIMPAYDYL